MTLQSVESPRHVLINFSWDSDYAAAFFVLAGQFRDGIRVCLRQIDDLELALMLARIADHRAEFDHDKGFDEIRDRLPETQGPVPTCGTLTREVIETTVLPRAHKMGDRWLSHWSLWNLGQRHEAIRHLTMPLKVVGMTPEDLGVSSKSLLSGSADWLSLYYDLRNRYFKNSPGSQAEQTDGWLTREEEFDLVHHRTRRLWRMGKRQQVKLLSECC